MKTLLLTLFLLLHTEVWPATRDIFAAPKGGWPDAAVGGGVIDLSTQLGQAQAKVLLSVPKSYSNQTAMPLALVLHGGPGGKASSMAGVFRGLLDAAGVISAYPQALKHQLLEWNYPHSSAYFLHIIRHIASRYHIDPKRIYLLGHSMGGGGAWAQGAVLADIWAGIGPLSGWAIPTPTPDFKRYKNLPIYCIHGDKDRAVPVALSRMAFKKLEKNGSKQHTFTTRPKDTTALTPFLHVYRERVGVGHNVFAKDAKQELSMQIAFLLAHQRRQAANIAAAQQSMITWGKTFGWTPNTKLGSYGK